jgi:hypothetical protein
MLYSFFGRPTMKDLRQDLRAVTKTYRSDWDITTPEMKKAWQESGDEIFYPTAKPTPKLSANRIERSSSPPVLLFAWTHSADFVPCFMAFATNARPYAVSLHRVIAQLDVSHAYARECRWVHPSLEYV